MIDRFHSVTICIFLFIQILFLAFGGNMVCNIIALVSVVIYALLRGRKLKAKVIIAYLIWGALIALVNPIFSHNGHNVIFYLNGNAVTVEAIIYGINMAITIMTVFIWCRVFSDVLTSDRIISLVSEISPKLALVISMMLRFVPMFVNEYKVRLEALSLIRRNSNIFDKITLNLGIFSSMITWSLEHSVESADSLKERRFGTGPRSVYKKERFKARDGWMLSLIFLSALLSLWLLYVCGFGNDFDRVVTIAGKGMSQWFLYIVYLAFCNLWTVAEIMERKKIND
ncbi:MAG: energy-coupling factor transporter transmembrane protein EcfT [Lachnospiraceae bacterium]|nr:energy-coupling factor transporter transmembrane protein EcfT [Lachnospiraceae bacterium]